MLEIVKRALPFLLTLILGVFLGSLFRSAMTSESYIIKVKDNFGAPRPYSCKSRYNYRHEKYYSQESSPMILFKPEPTYTREAKENKLKGIVRLLVEFRSDGTIGDINVLRRQPYGLTDEAIEAAKEIQFKPAMRYGEAVTVNKEVEYNFSIY